MQHKKPIVVIHYHEIALKGKNRDFFEKTLRNNIRAQAGDVLSDIKRISGRFTATYDEAKKDEVVAKLQRVFGIHHILLGRTADAELEDMKCVATELFAGREISSFRVTASRAEKHYPFTSHDIETSVGAAVQDAYNIPVSLQNPEVTLFVEVAGGAAYILSERIEGPGGLPVGTAGPVVALLSNGFDSPIAALLMMKRGCVPLLVHFHSYPYTKKDSLESVEKLVGILSQYAPEQLKCQFIPFADVQQHIVSAVPDSLRVIMYRRWMFRIAEMIAQKHGAYALVTGESVGQVASQTLENIYAIAQITHMPILRPLAGMDKEEVILRARMYGTYDISKLPYEDCCSLFVQGSPSTRAHITEIQNAEDPIRDELEKRAQAVLKQK